MAKNKLKRFKENETFKHLLQPSREEVLAGIDVKGNWGEKIFGNNSPIVLELGCGNGDYAVGLAKFYPEKNFIGIDLKGARLWTGAKKVQEENLTNVAFLRTQIELINLIFEENEVSEIWITFPDPQIKYKRAKHRLTHPNFLDMYKEIMLPEGQIHLKCDSEYLYGYTHGITQLLGCTVHESYHDIEKQMKDKKSVLFSIKTFYEEKWRDQGKAITYLRFSPDHA